LPKEYDDIYGQVKSADGAFEYNGYFVYEDWYSYNFPENVSRSFYWELDRKSNKK
jgi:hypothetical protein